jgi:hypothetical protein
MQSVPRQPDELAASCAPRSAEISLIDLLSLLLALGWDRKSDPFQPVTAERPEVQALLWKQAA